LVECIIVDVNILSSQMRIVRVWLSYCRIKIRDDELR